ncbi:hypothetical protein [Desulforamulus hydrothermalis]|uniref:hypothetical protein n=1 Tax=Desulforamulus hydrothermalis TaxID=412895 RepID=UPI00116047E1|nr:hypothetical protein [Desulforamulus hydrothermalis]
MFQDVSLSGPANCPLFFSANISTNNAVANNLTVEVLWLDENRNAMANGLRVFLPGSALGITYFDITDRPPIGTAFARLLFSKTEGTENSFIVIDQVILAPVKSSNLLVNPGFESGLNGWHTTGFSLDFTDPLEGLVNTATNVNGTVYQDVPLTGQPSNASFLLSFAALTTPFSQGPTAALTAQVLWLDAANNILGTPGLEINIPNNTLKNQFGYLTYLDLTKPAPAGAVKARILFTADVEQGFTLRLDHVIFARAATQNLIINPSFEDGLNGWQNVNTSVVSLSDVYEGNYTAAVDTVGGVLYQDVPLANAAGHCFLFNTGFRFRGVGSQALTSQVIINILWLDQNGREIGLGASLIIPPNDNLRDKWLVYTAITEPAPPDTVSARVQFTKAPSARSELDIDKVVLGRLV